MQFIFFRLYIIKVNKWAEEIQLLLLTAALGGAIMRNVIRLIGIKLAMVIFWFILTTARAVVKISHPFAKVDKAALEHLVNLVNNEVSSSMEEYYVIAEKALGEGKGPTAISTEVLMAMGKTMTAIIGEAEKSLNKATFFSIEYQTAMFAEVDHLSKWADRITDVVIAKANNVAEA